MLKISLTILIVREAVGSLSTMAHLITSMLIGQALTLQTMRVFSNFYYQTGVNYTGDTQLLPIPCKWGDASRMVSSIIQNNSQNTVITAPIFAVWIKSFNMSAKIENFQLANKFYKFQNVL